MTTHATQSEMRHFDDVVVKSINESNNVEYYCLVMKSHSRMPLSSPIIWRA